MKNKKIVINISKFIIFCITFCGIQFDVKEIIGGNVQKILLDTNNVVSQVFCVLGLGILYYVVKKEKFAINKNESFVLIVFSFLISVLSLIGMVIKVNNSVFFNGNSSTIFFLLWKFISVFLISSSITLLGFNIIKNYEIPLVRNNKTVWKSWLIYDILMILFWLPMITILYPGVFGWDGMDQVNQFFHAKSGNLTFYLTNHHPYVTTLIIGNLYKIGLMMFHNVNNTVTFVVLILGIFFIFSLNYLVVTIRKYYGNQVANYLFLFFCVFPVFSFWAMTIDKTVIFLSVFSLFVAELIIIINKTNKINYKDLMNLFISSVLIGLTRNDGFVYLVAVFIGALLYKKRRELCSTIIGAFVIVIIFNKILLPVIGVLPSEPTESMDIPVQQISRVYKLKPTSISRKQNKQLSKYMDVKQISKSYNPNDYDSVKNLIYYPKWTLSGSYRDKVQKLNNYYIVNKKESFYKLWMEIGKKNKGIYLDALIVSNFNYLYPTTEVSLLWNNQPGGKNTPSAYEYTKYTNGYNLFYNQNKLKYFNFILNLQYLPLLKILLSASFWCCSILLFSIFLLLKSLRQYLIIVLPMLFIILVDLAGPINGGLRYVFPLMIGLPILITLSLNYKKI